MSLDVRLTALREVEVFTANITHNLVKMAQEAGIYEYLWRPDECGIQTAQELIHPLSEGLKLLQADPVRFKAFDSPNGWGTYERFVPWLQRYLAACIANPDASVSASR